MLHADSARNRLIGIGLVSCCFMLFTVLDGSAKCLVTVMPVAMVVWLRFVTHAVFATLLLYPIKKNSLFKTKHLKWHLARAAMFMLMTGMNFWALQYLQLTVTASIFFTVPIIIALISARTLKEKLDAARWGAIIAGFAGVLVIVHPWSAEFHPAMILAVGNAFLYAIFNLMTRHLAAYDPPETIQYLPAVGAAIGLTPFAIAAWEWPEGMLEWTLACLLVSSAASATTCSRSRTVTRPPRSSRRSSTSRSSTWPSSATSSSATCPAPTSGPARRSSSRAGSTSLSASARATELDCAEGHEGEAGWPKRSRCRLGFSRFC